MTVFPMGQSPNCSAGPGACSQGTVRVKCPEVSLGLTWCEWREDRNDLGKHQHSWKPQLLTGAHLPTSWFSICEWNGQEHSNVKAKDFPVGSDWDHPAFPKLLKPPGNARVRNALYFFPLSQQYKPSTVVTSVFQPIARSFSDYR